MFQQAPRIDYSVFGTSDAISKHDVSVVTFVYVETLNNDLKEISFNK